MDPGKDYYHALGVAPDADPAVIRAAYRALSQKHHPDKVDAPQKDAANRRMAEINEAFAVLGDAALRAWYDEARDGSLGAQRECDSGHGAGRPDDSRRGEQRQHTTDEETESSPSASAGLEMPKRWRRAIQAGLFLFAVWTAVTFGIEEKSWLEWAWDSAKGGFHSASHYTIRWSVLIVVAAAWVFIARAASRASAWKS